VRTIRQARSHRQRLASERHLLPVTGQGFMLSLFMPQLPLLRRWAVDRQVARARPSWCPGQLAAIIRGRWAIEDRLHWIRDLDFDEDRSQIRTGNGPRIMAALRNLVVTILRLAGATNIAAALRYHARARHAPLDQELRP
jgi:hypothetical protein